MGLLEVVIAISLLLLIIVPMSYLFTNVLGQVAGARQEVTAIRLADSYLEYLNYTGPPNDTNGQPEVGVTVDQKQVTVSSVLYNESARFSWSPAGSGTPDLCTSGLAPELLLQVTVTWSPNHTITDSTLLNFPPSGVVTEGFLGIQVNGDPSGGTPPPEPNDVLGVPWSSRVTSVPIVVSSTSPTFSYNLHPAANGCTFLELTTGTYSVTVGSGPTTYTGSGLTTYTANYNEAPSETQPTSSASTISVNTDVITEVVFQYDEGADINLQYPSTTYTEDGIVCPNVSSGLTCLVAGQDATSATSPNTNPFATALLKTSSGWSAATLPSALVRIESTACSSGACIAVGYGSSAGAAAVAQSTSPSTWTASSLPSAANVTALGQIVCPTSATTPACFAIGTNTSGKGVILAATISSSSPHTVTWTTDTVPSVTAFSQLTCPSSSATPTCFVIGNASTPIIASFTSPSTWTAYTNVTAKTISQLACATTTLCYATGSTSSAAAAIFSIQTAPSTWQTDTMPGSPISLSSAVDLACPGSTQCYATVTGKTSSSGPVTPLVLSTAGTSTWANMSIPTTAAGALSQPVCPSTSVCFIPGSSTTGTPIVLSLKASPTAWVYDTLPAGLTSLSSVVCPSTTLCLAIATASSTAAILSTTGGSAPTWISDTISGTTGSPVFLSGLTCMSTTSCEAAGSSETAAFVLDDTSTGTPVFTGSGTPSLPAGLMIDNPPIMVSNLAMAPSTTLELDAPTTTVAPLLSIGPLFPFASGYSVAVGECASELTAASASAGTTPGAGVESSAGEQTATLPMGLLPIQVVSGTTGSAVSGATVSIADTCSSPLTPLSGTNSNSASYALPTSGADGLSRADVIYGTYNVTVTSGSNSATVSVTVSPTSVTVGTTTYYLPNAAVVAD
jgi:hypothetical protein